MSGKLEGKVALVTGASKGIGRGIAIALASAGARVAINFKKDAAGANETQRRIESAGGQGEVFQADIGSKPEFERLVSDTVSKFGRLDVLVNNATRTRFAPLFEVTEEDFDEVVDTNLRGPLFGSAAAAREMLKRGGGSIINVSSCAVRLMLPLHSAYSAAKGGLEALTRQLAVELAPRIRVNAIAPGPTNTERNQGYDANYDRKWGRYIPVGRVAAVNDYAGICVFLASDDSSFVTGQIIGIDGGWTLQGASPDFSTADFRQDRKRG